MSAFKCPKCEKVIKRRSMLSGNTFGAKQYSDGRMHAPMMPEYPRITECPKCGNIYWLKDEYEVPEYIPAKKHPFISQEDYDMNEYYARSNMDAKFLEPYQYIIALNRKIYETSKEEKFLRIRYWWSVNEETSEKRVDSRIFEKTFTSKMMSGIKGIFIEPTSEKTEKARKEIEEENRKYFEDENFADNLKKLILLLTDEIRELSASENKSNDENNEEKEYELENNTFMIAELHRNLGNFSECKNTLKNITNPDSLWLKELFEAECAKENKFVFLIKRKDKK